MTDAKEFAEQVKSVADKMREMEKPGIFFVKVEGDVVMGVMPGLEPKDLMDMFARGILGLMPDKKTSVQFAMQLVDVIQSIRRTGRELYDKGGTE